MNTTHTESIAVTLDADILTLVRRLASEADSWRRYERHKAMIADACQDGDTYALAIRTYIKLSGL